jgi:glutamate synthase domain-containing protein 1
MAGVMDEVGGILGNQVSKMRQRVDDTKEMMKRMAGRGGVGGVKGAEAMLASSWCRV